jgi:glycosyltransferase involved in cell wall biosynthesis
MNKTHSTTLFIIRGVFLILLSPFFILFLLMRILGRLFFVSEAPTRSKKKVLFLVVDSMAFYVQRLVMAKGVLEAGYEVHVAGADVGAIDQIEALGFKFHHLDLNRGGINPFSDLMPFLKLVLFLAKERPDILQCVSIKQVLYGATAGTIVGLKRIVCLINGLGYAFEGYGFKGKFIKILVTLLYKKVLALPGLRVIFQNPDDQNYFIENRIVDRDKTILIRGSGVDMDKFAPAPPPSNQVPVVLFVGRLLKSKGIFDLIEAAMVLKAQGLQFILRVVGEPDDRNPEAISKDETIRLHNEGIIEWVGRQSDMPKFYRESDIICLPTLYKEGLPLSLLEAASIGRPLIATDVPGCREIVRDGINGYLFPPKSLSDLTNVLKKLILNSEDREKFGKMSTQMVQDEFSGKIIQQKLNSVYEHLIYSK